MLNDMERHQIAREIWLHIQLNHPSIIALYAAWKDRDYIYLVLEWAPEGNVFTFLQQNGGRLPESVAVPMILEPTLSALNYIHQLVRTCLQRASAMSLRRAWLLARKPAGPAATRHLRCPTASARLLLRCTQHDAGHDPP